MGLLKKLCTGILSVCILAALLTAPVIAEEVDHSKLTFDDKAEILTSLGLLNKSGEIDLTSVVKRTEFADSMAMLENESLPKGVMEFDLTANDKGMRWLYERGFIDGYNQENFYPQSPIKLSEAVKIAVDMLGYKKIAEINGGYPEGYMYVADKLDMLKNVGMVKSEELQYEKFINLLYNIINTKTIGVSSISGDNIKLETSDDTLLSKYRKIYMNRDLVNADEVSGLYSISARTPLGRIMIGSDVYELGNTAVTDTLGYNMEYWYRDDDTGKTLLCAVPYKDKVLKIDANDIDSYSSGVYSYHEGSKAKRLFLDSDVIVIYNGANIIDSKVYVPQTGSIELIDNDDDGKYEVLKIRDKKLLVADRTNEYGDKFNIYDKFDGTYNIELTTGINRNYIICDTDGNRKDLKNITVGNVLEVEKSISDDPYYRITISDKNITAMITSITDNSIVTSEGEIELTSRFTELRAKGENDVQLNTECAIYLDSTGRAVYFGDDDEENDALAYRVAYLQAFYPNNGCDIEKPIIKLLDQGGTWEKFELADKVKIGGESIKSKTISNLSDYLGGIIKYRMNIQGEITELFFSNEIPEDTQNTPMDEDFQMIYTNSNAVYKYYPGGYVFGTGADPIVQIPGTCKLFIKPAEMTDETRPEECIGVASTSVLGDGSYYGISAYSVSGIPGIADVALITVKDTYGLINTSGQRPFAINNVIVAINDNGEEGYLVQGLTNGVEQEIFVVDKRTDTSAALPFGKGDLVFFYTDANNQYVIRDDTVSGENHYGYGWKMLCDYTDTGLVPYTNADQFKNSTPTHTVTGGNQRVKFGTVYDVKDNQLFVNYSDYLNDWYHVEAVRCIWGTVYVWDTDINQYRVGTIDDAVCSKIAGTSASKAYIANYNQYLVVAIYPSEN
ncbi:MAG: S-layer homology domain-containing protein [Clostridiales bacterium]|nr:S-layer homology domain-containing protein [Clostridiales bacterium]